MCKPQEDQNLDGVVAVVRTAHFKRTTIKDTPNALATCGGLHTRPTLPFVHERAAADGTRLQSRNKAARNGM